MKSRHSAETGSGGCIPARPMSRVFLLAVRTAWTSAPGTSNFCTIAYVAGSTQAVPCSPESAGTTVETAVEAAAVAEPPAPVAAGTLVPVTALGVGAAAPQPTTVNPRTVMKSPRRSARISGRVGNLTDLITSTSSSSGPAQGRPTYTCYTLTIYLGGNGSGSVDTTNSAGQPDGRIHCDELNGVVTASSVCSSVYADTAYAGQIKVYASTTPSVGSGVCDFGTGCYGGAAFVSFNLSSDQSYRQDFYLKSYPVQVTRSGTGSGTVTSTPSGIACGITCSYAFLFQSAVTLTAVPDAGATFSGWTGKCAGQDETCALSMPASTVTTNAVFGFPAPTPDPSSAPSVTPSASARASRPPATAQAPGTTRSPQATAYAGQSDNPALSTGATGTQRAGDTPTAPSSSAGAAPTLATGLVPAAVATPPADFTPIVLAILGAGLFIAIGLGALGLALRHRGRPTP